MQRDPLTVGSLFSGIGGIDLGLERASMVTRWFCEIDPHCRNVLARHWPGLPIYGDITAIDWRGVEPVDILAGGFPCQPVSAAGLQRAQSDERWLWPHFAAAIRALRPRYVLVENVRNLLAVNGGSAMGEVVGDLASLGYGSEWDCIPAAAVGAPHLRDRLWLVAHADGDGFPGVTQRDSAPAERERAPSRRSHADRRPHPVGRHGATAYGPASSILADADSGGWARWSGPQRSGGRGQLADGGQWTTEPDVGRVADGVPHRVDRLRALGNAVVPQVVEWIGRRIVAFDEEGALAA